MAFGCQFYAFSQFGWKERDCDKHRIMKRWAGSLSLLLYAASELIKTQSEHNFCRVNLHVMYLRSMKSILNLIWNGSDWAKWILVRKSLDFLTNDPGIAFYTLVREEWSINIPQLLTRSVGILCFKIPAFHLLDDCDI